MLTQTRRFILREATTEAHMALEAHVGALDSLPAYKRYLDRFHRYRTPVERALAGLDWPEAFGDWRPVAIGDLIANDLAALGLPVAELSPVSISNNISDIVGLCYVLEGSSLGAQILARQAAALGLHAGTGASHLDRQKSGVASWRKFIDLIELIADLDVSRSCAAANAAFASAESVFRDRA